MTVCIAVSADHGDRLVCAADSKISNAMMSAETFAAKLTILRGWVCLLSGTLSATDLLVDSFHAELSAAADNEPRTVRNCLEVAHRKEMGAWMAGRWLAPYGLTWQGYQDRAGNPFPEEYRSELARKMIQDADSNYDTEIIVCGWGDKARKTRASRPYIFSVNRDGIGLHETAGMYACGSGAPAASASLYFHNYRQGLTLAQAVYYVASAKFMAERSEGVGENTFLWVAKRESQEYPGGYWIQPDEIDEMRSLWIAEGAPRMPDKAERLIVKMLSTREKQQHVTINHMASTISEHLEGNAKQSTSEKSEPDK